MHTGLWITLFLIAVFLIGCISRNLFRLILHRNVTVNITTALTFQGLAFISIVAMLNG